MDQPVYITINAWKFCGLVLAAATALAALWHCSATEPPSKGFTPTKPAVPAAKVAGPTLNTPVKIVPKAAVKSKYPEAVITDDEEWVDTAKVPPAPNGGAVLTKIDTTTGEVKSQFKAADAPWFAFEHRNVIGTGYEVGTQGNKVPIYYRRDILRVKNAHLVGEVGGKVALNPAEKSEVHGALFVEGRFE